MVTPEDLLQAMAAVPSAVRVRPLSTSVTPVTPFFTVMEPLWQLPDTI